jgi:hypothetical protein
MFALGISMSDEDFLEFKVAGGAAAQTLGLVNAIFVQRRTGRPFKIRYFPHSTGTYWPFAVGFLLHDWELIDSDSKIRGFKPSEELPVGKIIRDHPLEKRFLSWERLLKWIRALGMEFHIKKLLGEIALESKPERLSQIDMKIHRVSGGYVPILDVAVMRELDTRFRVARGEKSPFSKGNTKDYIALHYRIGDKRAKFTHDKDFGGDGIFDPESFREILNELTLHDTLKLYVVSDEPFVAQKLLLEAGIEANLFEDIHDIWTDLYHLSQAKILLGSWSQVSQLAAICVSNNGGQSYLPQSTQAGTTASWKIPNTDFFNPKYLREDHEIYRADFSLDQNAHKGYTQKS